MVEATRQRKTSARRVDAGVTPRPFVKWAGGKGQLLPHLQPFMPARFSRYVEPFLGGGAVFFHLQPEQALLGDSNPELMEAFHVVQEDVQALIAALDRHAPHVLDSDYYYALRSAAPNDPVARAARFIYLNKTCYNGLYRVNRQGAFNVPFGRYKRPPGLYDAENLLAASRLLQGADLHQQDFAETMAKCRRGRFGLPGPALRPPLGHRQLYGLHPRQLRQRGPGAAGGRVPCGGGPRRAGAAQ